MENTKFIYAANSDLDDELFYAEFKTKDEAINYAMDHLDKLPFVDEIELAYDAEGTEDAISYKTIWDHTMAVQEEVAAAEDEAFWAFRAEQEAEAQANQANKYDLGDTTWFESMNNLVENMEENEDMVECKECFDLFPKADCVKLAFGYICPCCNKGVEVADSDIFKIDFPEYEKFSDTTSDFDDSKLAMSDEDVERINKLFEEPIENDPISTPEEAVPFLVNDEVEAVAGYEKAAEVVADSELENKEKILDTIDHIKEEEEEHIEELQDLIPEEADDEIIEIENDSISDTSVDTDETLVEDIADDELEAEIEKAKKTLELAKLNAKIEKQKTKSSKQVAKQAKSELSATKSANKATKDTSNTNVAVSNDEVKVSKNDLKKTKVGNKQQELQRKQTSEESGTEVVTETKYWLCKYDNNNIAVISAPTEAEAKEKFKTNYKDRYTFNACEWGVTEITKEEAAKYSDNKVTEGIGGNIFTGAATGASLGSLLGPAGGVAGAAVGAVSGLVKSLFNTADSLTKKLGDKSKIKKALNSDPELKDIIEKIKEETGESDTEKILTWIEDYYKQKVFNNVDDAFDEFNDEAREVEETAVDVEESGILAEEVHETKYWICFYDNNDVAVIEAANEREAEELFVTEYSDEYFFDSWDHDWSVEEISKEEYDEWEDSHSLFTRLHLPEHVNKECPAIESDQKLDGTDNAVVDCKVADVVTHSEDEKPVDCEGKKKPLEKPLTEGFMFSLNNEKDLAEFTKLCKEVGIKTIGDLDRFTKETVGEPGNVLDKLRAYRKELGADFKFNEAFTREEQEEYNMDEEGNSLDSYDHYVRCTWCDEIFTEDQCVFEADMGWLCDRCYEAILSRGEKLTIIKNPTAEDIAKTLDEALTEDTEDENGSISNDPGEKPSKPVKMANTASTSGMDFESACEKFGITLEN